MVLVSKELRVSLFFLPRTFQSPPQKFERLRCRSAACLPAGRRLRPNGCAWGGGWKVRGKRLVQIRSLTSDRESHRISVLPRLVPCKRYAPWNLIPVPALLQERHHPGKKMVRAIQILTESLILAQDERWRRVLGMQVERFSRSNTC